jgi:hypothetical protein
MTGPVSAADTLEAEARMRRWVVPAAAAAALLPLIANVAGGVALRNGPDNRISGLLFLGRKAGLFDALSVLLAVGAVAVGVTLLALLAAVRARRPDLPRWFKWAAIIGAGGYALIGTVGQLLLGGQPPFGVVFQVVWGQAAAGFGSNGAQTFQEANDIFSGTGFAIMAILVFISSLALAVAFAGLSLNAMRVGLLPRFVGYVGIFTGVLVVIPLLSTTPVVQSFWLGAVAALFAGRWPSEAPPAWRTGQAEPWPTVERRPRGARPAADAPAEPASVSSDVSAPPAVPTRPGAARRKRKHRR